MAAGRVGAALSSGLADVGVVHEPLGGGDDVDAESLAPAAKGCRTWSYRAKAKFQVIVM